MTASSSRVLDSRWSAMYRRLDTASKIASPFFIAAAIATLLAAPVFRDRLAAKAAGLLTLLGIVVHNLFLGSNPRYVLPFLPGLLFLTVRSMTLARRSSVIATIVVFVAALFGLRQTRAALGWEWGKIEASGIVIEQEIPRGSLPPQAPATLHLRIAAAVLPTSTGLEVTDSDGTTLFSRSGALRAIPRGSESVLRHLPQ